MRFIMMPANRIHAIEWLTAYVGPVLWSRPAVLWQGHGWDVCFHTDWLRYAVTVDDMALGTEAALRWG